MVGVRSGCARWRTRTGCRCRRWRSCFPRWASRSARRGGHYLAVTNGAVGTKGFGNHKHNELLSFEYHCDGAPVIVDPGSFCYTSDFAARNLFRGTAYHNTIVVDGIEQNEINPEWIFRMFEKANPEHLGFAEDGDWVEYRGRHHGYERLDRRVTHERSLRLNRETRPSPHRGSAERRRRA